MMNRPPPCIPESRGFSLTELLVAMVIGLVLLGGLVTLMVNSKKNYAQQDYSARLQENARFAMQFLSYDVRMAGYYGCSNEIINDDTITAVNVPNPSTNPDEVTITYAEPYDADAGIEIVDVADSNPNLWTLNRLPDEWGGDLVGDTVVVGDCGSSAVTTVTAIDSDNTTITVSGGLDRIFDPDINDAGPITVRRFVSNTYAIDTAGQSGIPVLTRDGEELVEGVENIRLLYQAAAGENFVAGGSAPARPVAVQLGALLRSVSNEVLDAGANPDREYGSGAGLTVDDGQHQLLDQNLDVGELRGQRRVFTTTLAVRNREL